MTLQHLPRTAYPAHDPHRGATTAPTVINVFPATFSDDIVAVGVGRWTTPEAAKALREEHPGLRTWRDVADGSRLYAWFASAETALPPGFRPVTVRLDEAPMIFKRMLTDAVEARFVALGFDQRRDAFVNYAKGSIVAQVPALAGVATEGLGIYPKIVPRVHYTWTAANTLIIGLVVDVLYTTRLDVPVSAWLAAGIEDVIKGSYVVLLPHAPEAKQYPHLVGRSLGRVDLIRQRHLRLEDPRDPDLVEVLQTSVAPEPTRANLGAYLAARDRKAWQTGERELKARIDNLVRPKRRHELAHKAVERLTHGLSDGLPVHGALRATFGGMLRAGGTDFPISRLREPTYRFDPVSDSRTATRVDVGLRQHGPYDQRDCQGKQMRILVVGLEENRREIEAALRKLEDGIATPQRVFGGLRTMYRLRELDIVHAFAPRTRANEMVRYATATAEAIRRAPARGPGRSKFDLVITVIQRRFRELPDSENPYFQTKALALVLDGVPTQAVFIENLRVRDRALQYILNTMALACYAKMGGTSHVLDVRDDDEGTELVFGIGRAMVGQDRHGDGREETIGFATVFRANGQYLFNDCTPYCQRDRYEVALEQTIIGTVEKVAAFQGLTDGAKLRLIFHVPRRPGRHEERAVLNAVGKLPRFDVTFALVHVNDDHHFQAFDTSNTTGRGWRGEKAEAALMTKRGLCMALGPDERLVTFVGADQYRGFGSPGPVLVRLDARSTIEDIDYLAQQLYLLSFMNVGSLNPGVAPTTIAYAEKLAQLTGHLRRHERWSVELIHEKLGRRLWFI